MKASAVYKTACRSSTKRANCRRLWVPAGISAFFLFTAACGHAPHANQFSFSAEEQKRIEELTRELKGELVFERRDAASQVDSVYEMELGATSARCLAENARYPRWSPDGQQIAFVRGHSIMIMNRDGSQPRELATTQRARSVNFDPNGKVLVFPDTDGVKAVPVEGGPMRMLIPGTEFVAAASTCDGARLMTVQSRRRGEHHLVSYDLTNNVSTYVDDGCSCTIAPDGQRFTDLAGGHRSILIRAWEEGFKVSGKVDGPRGFTIDNEFWSNDPDSIVTRSEQAGHQNIYLLSVSRNRAFKITGFNDCDRPDLRVTWRQHPRETEKPSSVATP